MEEQQLKEPGAKFTGDPYNPQQVVLPLHVQRMGEETTQVLRRLKALSEFIDGGHGPTFFQLPVLEQRLMVEQLDQMTAYAQTLSLRYHMALLNHG